MKTVFFYFMLFPRNSVLIVPVPGPCLPFTFHMIMHAHINKMLPKHASNSLACYLNRYARILGHDIKRHDHKNWDNEENGYK